MAQTIPSASAQAGLQATHTLQKASNAGPITVGQALSRTTWTDANIAYTFRFTATTILDSVELDLESGAVTTAGGTPTVVWNGEDPEGFSLGTMSELYGIHVQTTVDGQVNLSGYLKSEMMNNAGDFTSVSSKNGVGVSGSTTHLTISIFTIGGQAEVTVIGKTA